MASIQEIKNQIQTANAIGRENLAKKGVEIAENATTAEIMKGIKNIVAGGASGNSSLCTHDTSIMYKPAPRHLISYIITLPYITHETEVTKIE